MDSTKELKESEALAEVAEIFAEATRVHLARVRWNANHPDAKGANLSTWHNKAVHAKRILALMLNKQPLKPMDHDFLAQYRESNG